MSNTLKVIYRSIYLLLNIIRNFRGGGKWFCPRMQRTHFSFCCK